MFTEKERAEVTLNSIGDAVLCTDLPGRVTYLNTVAEAMTGWPREEAIGRPLAEVFRIIDGMTRMLIANPAERAIRENLTIGLASDSVLVRRDGVEVAIEDSSAPIHNRDGSVAGAVIVFHDVTESRAMTQKMAHLAQHDFLTGLPNRALLIERLTGPLAWRNGIASNWPCCSSTSIISRPSMIPWGTRSATNCCSPWRHGCSNAFAPRIRCAARGRRVRDPAGRNRAAPAGGPCFDKLLAAFAAPISWMVMNSTST